MAFGKLTVSRPEHALKACKPIATAAVLVIDVMLVSVLNTPEGSNVTLKLYVPSVTVAGMFKLVTV
ncbi:hypothetical protein [Algibacter lectus]|uniref:hypothetical protein n=1 Tax=Algibacter lectus TaxID=221126 RepID=UPI0005A928CA|nr:hypothetical protein [Algibacter lectus]